MEPSCLGCYTNYTNSAIKKKLTPFEKRYDFTLSEGNTVLSMNVNRELQIRERKKEISMGIKTN